MKKRIKSLLQTFSMADVLVISNFDSVPHEGYTRKARETETEGDMVLWLQIGKWRSEYGGILNRMWHIN